jgi:hypothetical protein
LREQAAKFGRNGPYRYPPAKILGPHIQTIP